MGKKGSGRTKRGAVSEASGSTEVETAAKPETPAAGDQTAVEGEALCSKSIVLFSDGTGNSSAKLFKTNVWRMYEAVDLGPPAEGLQRQIAFYDDGVGTSSFRPLRLAQGVFGWGLKRNVLEIYRYACRNYEPASVSKPESGITEKGDHIFGFGFSRGAFTMRLVIALIADQGLVPYTNEADLKRKASAAYREFCRKGRLSGGRRPTLGGKKRGLDDYDPSQNHEAVIRFIGVWDTVSAYGGPFAELTRAIDNWVYRLSMPHYGLKPAIRRARHALALDDERDAFWPLLWDEIEEQDLIQRRKEGEEGLGSWIDEMRLQQVWFTGMHGDVGGGYPDESLSYVSLLWMMEEAHAAGLRTFDHITARYQALANSYGPMHDSRGGFASYYRYQPRKIAAWLHPPHYSTLSARDPEIADPQGRQKGLLRRIKVHESAIARIASGTDGYAPIVLPRQFEIVPPGHLRETRAQATTGGDGGKVAAGAKGTPLLQPEVLARLSTGVTRRLGMAMEQAWDFVWLRRVTYFLTVFFTLLLVAMPWWVPRELEGVIYASGGALFQPVLAATSYLIRLTGELLPDFVKGWTDAWANNPLWFIFFVLAILCLRRLGSRLQGRVRDSARSLWDAAVAPAEGVARRAAGQEPRRISRLEKVRNSRPYQRTLQILKWRLLPNWVFGPALFVLIIGLSLGVVTQMALPTLETGNRLCPYPASNPPKLIDAVAVEFETGHLCNPVGQRVQREETYTFSFQTVKEWEDGGYATDPLGLPAGKVRWGAGYVGVPFRRVIDASYLQPLVAIRTPARGGWFGWFGSVQIHKLDLEQDPDDPRRYWAEFKAPADGEIFLFANDAIVPVPGIGSLFYSGIPTLLGEIGRNKGTACVTIVHEGSDNPPVKLKEGGICTAAEKEAAQ